MSASAVSISLVYQNPSDPFFNTTAQATMNQAAADVSFAITTSLNSLTQDVYTGTNGSTTATANWSLSYTNPTDGTTQVTLPTFALGIDEIVIYIGSRDLPGSTLGVGGPGGAGIGLSGGGLQSQWVGAVDAMEASSNAGMVRGGPVLGTFSGTSTLGSTPAGYDLSYGYTVGALAIDSLAVWNLDYSVLPTAGQNDLYSVAVHEMIHAIGFGIAPTWDEHVSGTNWNGSAVVDLLGSGVGVLSAGGDHIANGLTGTPLIDGVFQIGQSQEALMDPTLLVGTRKYLTDLDLAFLQDMGWEVQVVPEPSVALLVLAGGIGFLIRRGRKG